jgi:hypothetical protein
MGWSSKGERLFCSSSAEGVRNARAKGGAEVAVARLSILEENARHQEATALASIGEE